MISTLIFLGITLVSAAVSYLAKKDLEIAERRKHNTPFTEDDIPKVDEHTPIPVIYGTVELTSPLIAWYKVQKKGRDSKNANRRRWMIYAHLVFCQGPITNVYQVMKDGKPLAGIPTAGIRVADSPQTVTVSVDDQYDLWKAPMQLLGGRDDQDVPDLFKQDPWSARYIRPGEMGEAYRGVFSITFGYWADGETSRGLIMEESDKRFPTISAIANRNPGYLIGPLNFANPAWIIEDLLTNKRWGLGLDPSKLDSSAFLAARNQLHAEQFGLNFKLTEQTPVLDMVDEVLRHVDGVRYVDRKTGKIVIKLIREVTDHSNTIELTPDNVREITAFHRPSTQGLPTQQAVTYMRVRKNGDENIPIAHVITPGWKIEEASVQAHDAGAALFRGLIAAQPQDYPGIGDSTTARRVAQRDLKVASTPTATIELTVNADAAASLNPGDVFKLTWPELDLEEVIFRVGAIDYGTLTDGSISIQAVEDIFSFQDENPVREEPPVTIPPVNPIKYVLPFELPYWLRYANRDLIEEDEYALPPAPNEKAGIEPGTIIHQQNGVMGCLAMTDDPDHSEWGFYFDGLLVGRRQFSKYTTLTHPVLAVYRQQVFITLPAGFHNPQRNPNALYALAKLPAPGTSKITEYEFVRLKQINNTPTDNYVFYRGFLDTPVLDFPAGSLLIEVADTDYRLIVPPAPTPKPYADPHYVRAVPITAGGRSLPVGSTENISNAFKYRSLRPLPVADAYTLENSGDTYSAVAWKFRRRLDLPISADRPSESENDSWVTITLHGYKGATMTINRFINRATIDAGGSDLFFILSHAQEKAWASDGQLCDRLEWIITTHSDDYKFIGPTANYTSLHTVTAILQR